MENLAKKPAKSILKNSSSLERQNSNDKDIKWDEINILQTLHPADKDYGHMKIEEPKTPYSYYVEDDEGEVHSDTETPIDIDPDNLTELINKSKAKAALDEENKAKKKSSLFVANSEDDDDDEEEDLEGLTDEEKLKRQDFEVKRKKHYNEYQMVKLARKLLQDELDELDESEDGNSCAKPDSSASQSNASNSNN